MLFIVKLLAVDDMICLSISFYVLSFWFLQEFADREDRIF